MRLIGYSLCIILIILINSCNTNEIISESEKQLIFEELQNRLDGYADAFVRKDLVWIQNFWSDNSDFAYAADGTLLTNYDSVITYRMQNYLPKVKEVPYFNFIIERGSILNKDAASVATSFDWAQVLISGDTIRAKGTWLFVFKKTNYQWSVVQSAGTHIRY